MWVYFQLLQDSLQGIVRDHWTRRRSDVVVAVIADLSLLFLLISRLIHRYKACDTIKDMMREIQLSSRHSLWNHPLLLMTSSFKYVGIVGQTSNRTIRNRRLRSAYGTVHLFVLFRVRMSVPGSSRTLFGRSITKCERSTQSII
jgi:hypothetical protein